MSAHTPSSSEIEIRKGLGRAYLNADRIDKAMETFAAILRDYPMDVDAPILLGDCYLADGKTEKAARLYAEALKLNPENLKLKRRLKLAQQEDHFIEGNLYGGEVIPTDSDVIAGVLQRMTNRSVPINGDEISRTADLLHKFIKSPHPAQEVSNYVEELDNLLLALLELNIQQARADSRPDLSFALQNLRDNIYLQLGVSSASENFAGRNARLVQEPNGCNILMLCQKDGGIPPRLALVAEALISKGCETRILTDSSIESVEDHDVILVSRPHVDSKILDALITLNAKGNTIILDLEADFEQMPVEHHDYEYLGLSTLCKARAYTKALLLADQICVHSNYLASILHNIGYRVEVIPDCWSNKNPLWDKPSVSRQTLNLGWIGTSGQIEDVTPVRRIITRVLREFPEARLVIGGEPDVYRMFDSIPESRRLFLPNVSYEYCPYLLSQIDVLLTPLRNIAFNRSLSDRWLMEAGVRRIPWVSSPLPTVVAWGAGGLVADTPEEWHHHLRQLVIDKNIRTKLGSSGRQKAERREMNNLIDLWYRMIYDTWREKQNIYKE